MARSAPKLRSDRRSPASLQPVLIYESRELMAKAAAAPLPAPKFTKPTLNRTVQLLKRHRDKMFEGDKDAPISAIIATLSARSYQHHAQNSRFSSQIDF